MLFFLTLTQSCNLTCTYCGSSDNYEIEIEDLLPPHPKEISFNFSKNISKLQNIKNLIICFYGGEPLMKPNLIKETIELLPNAKFCLQTNGTFIENLDVKIIPKLDSILISIDGDEKITNLCRGEGTYQKIIKNCKFLKKDLNYNGDLIARMTVHEKVNIYDSVIHLLFCENSIFNHVHWQLDVLWDSPKFARWNDFLKWRDENYNPGILKLIKFWLNHLQKEKKVLGIVPFQRIMYSLLKNEKTQLRCGSGLDSFNVTTSGSITACPIAPEFNELDAITNPKFNYEKLKNSVKIGGKCLNCDILDLCGGRCLYANKTSWWGEDGFDEVCVTIKFLIKELIKIKDEVKKLVDIKVVDIEEFNYPKYNNSLEIIP